MITIPALVTSLGVPPVKQVRITIGRDDQWKASAVMAEPYAKDLASECRARGLLAVLEPL